MTSKAIRRTCPTCGRRVTIKADRFIEHLVASYSQQYCPYGGCTVEDALELRRTQEGRS